MTSSPPLPNTVAIGVTLEPEFEAVAKWIRSLFGPECRLVLVHAVELPSLPSFLSGGMATQDQIRDALVSQAEGALREVADRIDAGSCEVVVRVGRAHEVLHSVTQEVGAGLLVVRRHEEQPIRKRILGSTAERVVVSSPVPVLVLGEGEPGALPTRILATIDGSGVTPDVLGWARTIAAATGAEIHVLHVLDAQTQARARLVSSPTHAEEMRTTLLEETDEWIEKTLEAAGLDQGAVKTRLVIGRPAPEILTAEEELGTGLVILGSRGQGAVQTLLLGSVARKVVHEAESPVFVIPDPSD